MATLAAAQYRVRAGHCGDGVWSSLKDRDTMALPRPPGPLLQETKAPRPRLAPGDVCLLPLCRWGDHHSANVHAVPPQVQSPGLQFLPVLRALALLILSLTLRSHATPEARPNPPTRQQGHPLHGGGCEASAAGTHSGQTWWPQGRCGTPWPAPVNRFAKHRDWVQTPECSLHTRGPVPARPTHRHWRHPRGGAEHLAPLRPASA